MVSSLRPLRPVEMAYFKRSLCGHYRFASDYSTIAELTDALDLADKLIELCGEGEALYLTIRSLQSIKKDELANTLRKTCRRGKLAPTPNLKMWKLLFFYCGTLNPFFHVNLNGYKKLCTELNNLIPSFCLFSFLFSFVAT